MKVGVWIDLIIIILLFSAKVLLEKKNRDEKNRVFANRIHERDGHIYKIHW